MSRIVSESSTDTFLVPYRFCRDSSRFSKETLPFPFLASLFLLRLSTVFHCSLVSILVLLHRSLLNRSSRVVGLFTFSSLFSSLHPCDRKKNRRLFTGPCQFLNNHLDHRNLFFSNFLICDCRFSSWIHRNLRDDDSHDFCSFLMLAPMIKKRGRPMLGLLLLFIPSQLNVRPSCFSSRALELCFAAR